MAHRRRLTAVARRSQPPIALPDAVRAVARGLSAGLPLEAAFRRAADALDDPTAAVMRECAAALEAGEPIASALAPLCAAPGGAIAAGAIELHGILGGDVVRSLSAIAESLADRERLRLEARAATAQARVAARIVPLAPVASLALLLVLAPGAARAILLQQAGQVMLLAAAGLAAIALLLLRRIARSAGL